MTPSTRQDLRSERAQPGRRDAIALENGALVAVPEPDLALLSGVGVVAIAFASARASRARGGRA